MKMTIEDLQRELMHISNQSTSALTHTKVQIALDKVRRAIKLVEEAELTLAWAQREMAQNKSN